jgi:Fur family transcriptional regulator, ferric uptake regulator
MKPEEKLKKAGLKITPVRLEVLDIIQKAKKALSSHQIIESASGKYDRVSVFRTINSFVEKGIMHPIPTSTDYVVYSICSDKCEILDHHDNHSHFVCDKCGSVFCFDDVVPENASVPGGFKVIKTELLISGLCKKCNK